MVVFAQSLGVYWLTSNVISVTSMSFIKIPAIKARLGIPDAVPPPVSKFSKPVKESFFQSIKRGEWVYNHAPSIVV